MMARQIEAVYENGVFKPLTPVKLTDGQKVQVYIPWAESDVKPEELLELMRQAHEESDGLSDEDWAEIEQSWKRGRP
jgi:predicted DNA-binding antitoxin AbrB/MazE fold protein